MFSKTILGRKGAKATEEGLITYLIHPLLIEAAAWSQTDWIFFWEKHISSFQIIIIQKCTADIEGQGESVCVKAEEAIKEKKRRNNNGLLHWSTALTISTSFSQYIITLFNTYIAPELSAGRKKHRNTSTPSPLKKYVTIKPIQRRKSRNRKTKMALTVKVYYE